MVRAVMRSITCVLGAAVAFMLLPSDCAAVESAAAVIRLEDNGKAHMLTMDGRHLGRLVHDGPVTRLMGNPAEVRITRSEEPIAPGTSYPVRVVITGELGDDARVEQRYDLLAPETPIDIEGMGLTLADEDPEINGAEHEELRAWLAEIGLGPDTSDFENLHLADTGRALRVWYEIAGRRIDGTMTRGGQTEPSARYDSLWHVVEEGGFKIHHARELFYHRESLEMVDTLTDLEIDEPRELRSYQCGCYGWAIGGDWVTLGDEYLYHAVVEWRHHRVGAGLFLGLETKSSFPFLGWADREKASRLARRAGTYRLTDARGDVFAEIEITLDRNPPHLKLGPQGYLIRATDAAGKLEPLARVEARPGLINLQVFKGSGTAKEALQRLDTLFAALPTHMIRGDGIRDSYLGQVETLVDWIRLVRNPNEDTLADVVSEIDALTAVPKVRAMIAPHADRFAIEHSDYQPPAPKRRMDEATARVTSP